MLEKSQNIFIDIENLIKKINKWQVNLKKELSESSKEKIIEINLFLVNKEWLNGLIEGFENFKFNNNQLLEKFKEDKEIYNFPQIFPLNIDSWNCLQNNKNHQRLIHLKGIFLNNILLINMEKYINSNIYSIFFLDSQQFLK